MRLRNENHTTYAMVPGPLADRICDHLKSTGYDCDILVGNDIPDYLERSVDMDGHKQNVAVCCIRSMVNANDVHDLMLRTWLPSKYGRPEDE